MKNIKRNIVYIGYDSYYKDTLKLHDTKINNVKPNLINIDTLEELDRKQGFLLLFTMDELYDYFPNIVDIFEPDVYEIDRYLRKKFKNFEQLKDNVLFNKARIDVGGYGIVWNENIDISSEELWKNGIMIEQ